MVETKSHNPALAVLWLFLRNAIRGLVLGGFDAYGRIESVMPVGVGTIGAVQHISGPIGCFTRFLGGRMLEELIERFNELKKRSEDVRRFL